jgi:hypothetical protein
MKWLHEHGEFHVVLLLLLVTGALRTVFTTHRFYDERSFRRRASAGAASRNVQGMG